MDPLTGIHKEKFGIFNLDAQMKQIDSITGFEFCLLDPVTVQIGPVGASSIVAAIFKIGEALLAA